MITLFDLRNKQDQTLYQDIEKLYHEPIKIVPFNEPSIQPCIGCWNCWLKTPGKCVMKDAVSAFVPRPGGFSGKTALPCIP